MNDSQIQKLRRRGRQAAIELCHRIVDDYEDLIELAIERALTLGVQEYGDVSYHKPIERLEVEVDEELADALFYQHLIIRARGLKHLAEEAEQ